MWHVNFCIDTETARSREQLSARFDHDLDKLVAFFQEEEKKSASKLRNFQKKKKVSNT